MNQQRFKTWTNRAATPQNMTLNSDPIFYVADKEELLNYIPPIKGSNILELGCGIGRFTGELSHRARHVTAVDLVQQYIDSAQTTYGHLNNLTLLCSSILKLDLPKESFDMVFSSWIFGNHSERETLQILELVLNWLRPGGHLIFRESGPDSYVLKVKHPAQYRTPILYDKLLKKVTGNGYSLSINRFRNSRTYISMLKDVHQVYYVVQKVPTQTSPPDTTCIGLPPSLPLPTIKGQDFTGAGAVAGNTALVIGCGSGGLVLHLARTCLVSVIGLDPVAANIDTAIHRQHRLSDDIIRLVRFEMIDTEDAEFCDDSFNVILVRDSELRTPRQYRLLPKLRRWVKPGGSCYIIDDNTFRDEEPPVEAREVLVIGLSEEEAAKQETQTGKHK